MCNRIALKPPVPPRWQRTLRLASLLLQAFARLRACFVPAKLWPARLLPCFLAELLLPTVMAAVLRMIRTQVPVLVVHPPLVPATLATRLLQSQQLGNGHY